jgi:hypothetical protein
MLTGMSIFEQVKTFMLCLVGSLVLSVVDVAPKGKKREERGRQKGKEEERAGGEERRREGEIGQLLITIINNFNQISCHIF